MNTEDEAKTKWCPLVRVGNDAGCNRSSSDFGATASCIGSACMAWRNSSEMFSLATGKALIPGTAYPSTDVIVPRKSERGYCGAFGRPE